MSNIAIIGHGFVGGAVHNGFDVLGNTVTVVDPRVDRSVTISGLPNDLDAAFVCVPTPVDEDGSVDASIADGVVDEFVERYGRHGEPLLIVKSTVTPDHLEKWADLYDNLVFNPEFLTEANADDDFLFPDQTVFGSRSEEAIERAFRLYIDSSKVEIHDPVWRTSLRAASMAKYGINSLLATKLTFMNELRRVVGDDDDWRSVATIIGSDPRIGPSHTSVPGSDGRFGWSGSCFPKDSLALSMYADKLGESMTQLKATIVSNAVTRLEYPLTDREKAMGIDFREIISIICSND